MVGAVHLYIYFKKEKKSLLSRHHKRLNLTVQQAAAQNVTVLKSGLEKEKHENATPTDSSVTETNRPGKTARKKRDRQSSWRKMDTYSCRAMIVGVGRKQHCCEP